MTEPAPLPTPSSRGPAVALLVVTLAAAAWRVAGLDDESAWYDEAISYDLAGRPYAEILRDRAADGHPPVHPMLLRAWTSLFGRTVVSMRAMSALFGTLAIPLLYAVAARRRGAFAGLCAATLAAGSSFLVRYSQEARDYALLFLASTASFLALDRASDKPTAGRLATWSLSMAATLWSSVYGTFVLATQVLWLVGVGVAARIRGGASVPWSRALPWVLAGAAGVAAYVPWIVVLGSLSSDARGGLWVPLPDAESLYSAFRDYGGTRRGLALLGVLAAVGVWHETRATGAARRGGTLRIAWFLGPPLLPFLFSYLAIPAFVRRGTIVGVGGFLALAASGIDALRGRRLLFAGGIAIAVAALVFGLERQVSREDREDWRGIARQVAARARPGDLVLVRNRPEEVALGLYLGRDDLRIAHRIPTVRGAVDLSGRDALWVVTSQHVRGDDGLERALSERGYRPVEHVREHEIDLDHWSR